MELIEEGINERLDGEEENLRQEHFLLKVYLF